MQSQGILNFLIQSIRPRFALPDRELFLCHSEVHRKCRHWRRCITATFKMNASEIGPELSTLLDPMGAFMVKGWSRSMAAMMVMRCAWESPEFRQAQQQRKLS